MRNTNMIEKKSNELLDGDRLALTTSETARVLGVSEKTVLRLCQRGLLKRSNALRTLLIPRSSIEEFLTRTTT